jgi:uncharacterized membrane protein
MAGRTGALGMWIKRPRLGAAIATGLAVGAGCRLLLLPSEPPSTSAIAGWNAFCLTFLALIASAIWTSTPEQIRGRAAVEDEGRGLILFLTLGASIASLAAVAAELSLAKQAQEMERWLRVGGAFATVALSWLVVQAFFALHYAHEYYTADPETGGDAKGLAFPGDEPPDYRDFLHFSIVIGVASQTADIAFTAKGLRRIGTVHSLIAFAFNTVVVALTLNLLAGLF